MLPLMGGTSSCESQIDPGTIPIKPRRMRKIHASSTAQNRKAIQLSPVTSGTILNRSPVSPVHRMNLKNVHDIIVRKSGKAPKFFQDAALVALADFLEQPTIANYLRTCIPVEVLYCSGVRLLPLEAIRQEMAEGAAPGSFLRPYRYLVVATSIGGNAVCFHSPSGRVYWADHDSFTPDCIAFKNRTTGHWEYIHKYNPENVRRALVSLGNDIEGFLMDLLEDRLTSYLESLD